MKEFKPLIVILGPTATGKTASSLALAKKFNGVIISADSRAIYIGLDIATAKPTSQEQKQIKHYMIDIVEPDKTFSVAEFKKMAEKLIDKIFKKGKIPFLVGGTGLYIDAITKGLNIPNIPADQNLRNKLKNKSTKDLIKILEKLDPESLKKIDKKNKVRLIRAIEVCIISGHKFSEQQKSEKPKYNILQIGITLERNTLYNKINERVDNMVKNGLIDECKMLLEKGYSPVLSSMTGLGYKQFGMYLRGEITLERAIYLMKRDTRRFARRQMTWFKKDKSIHWIKNQKEAEKLIEKFLHK